MILRDSLTGRFVGKKPVEIVCIVCGKKRLGPEKGKYCSRQCYWKSKKGKSKPIQDKSLSEAEEQIIIGSLLGDGHVSKRFYYSESHSPKQEEYIIWKKNNLPSLNVRLTKSIIEFDTLTGKRNRLVLRIYSHKREFLKKYRELFYINNKKVVKPELLEKLDDIAFAVWIMDDGNFWLSRLKIDTLSFSKEENQLLVNWINKKYGINSRVAVKKSKYKGIESIMHYIVMSKNDTEIIRNKIGHLFIPSMRYKLGLDPEKLEVQRKWRKESLKKYSKSEKGKNTAKRFAKTDKFKAQQKRYSNKPEVKERRRERERERRKRPEIRGIKNAYSKEYYHKNKEYFREYQQRPEVKARLKEWRIKYKDGQVAKVQN